MKETLGWSLGRMVELLGGCSCDDVAYRLVVQQAIDAVGNSFHRSTLLLKGQWIVWSLDDEDTKSVLVKENARLFISNTATVHHILIHYQQQR